MRLSWFYSLLFVVSGVCEWAAAGPTVTAVAGASNSTLTGTITIFGGLGGSSTSCSAPDTYTTCNSCNTTSMAATACATSPRCACNTNRIYDGLIMTISFSNSTKDANGNVTTTNGPILVTTSAATTTPISGFTSDPNGAFVQVSWSTICSLVGGGTGSTCDGLAGANSTVSLNFYTDANRNGTVDSGETATAITFRMLNPGDNYSTFGTSASDGIGTFDPYPGDGKVYIKDPQTSTSFPSLGGYGGTVKNVRVFYATTNLGDANPVGAESKDLAVTDDGESLAKNIVDGLTNGTLYFFRLGMLDEANNVVQLSPEPANDPAAADASCSSGTSSCKYAATPDQVLGLLSDDFNCFVATAAYGSMLEPKLAIFREFRSRFLLRNGPGRAFTSWYYAYGPYAARFIGDKPWARAVTRGILWPAWGFSWLAVHYGMRLALSIAALVLATLFWIAHVSVARRTGARD